LLASVFVLIAVVLAAILAGPARLLDGEIET
jgi:hypothetical protein